MQKRIEELERKSQEFETVLRVSRWLLGFIIATILGSLTVIATKIFSWGYDSGEVENRLKHIEKSIDKLERKELQK